MCVLSRWSARGAQTEYNYNRAISYNLKLINFKHFTVHALVTYYQ